MNQRTINDPTTQTAKRKINQFFNVKTGYQLALQLLQQGVDLLTTQQLKIKNQELIRKKQIENAYKYAKDVFNIDLLNKRDIRRKQKKDNVTIMPFGNVFTHFNIIKKIKNPVTFKIIQNGEVRGELTLDKGGVRAWDNYYLFAQITSKKFWTDKKGVQIQMIQSKPIKKTKPIKQSFKEGKFNCVLNHVFQFFEKRMNETDNKKTKQNYKSRCKKTLELNDKYFDIGVDEEGLYDIANTLQIDINITLPFQDQYIEVKSNKRGLRTFNYINTRLNHVDYDEMSYEDNRVEKTTSELITLQRHLDRTKQHYTYQKGSNISGIRTTDTLYILEGTYNEVVNEFEIKTGLINCKIDSIANPEVTEFIRDGVHFNQTMDFDLEDCAKNHIDMKKAYANYKMCKYYDGFLGKPTDFRKCDKMEGIGYYRIQNIQFNNSILEQWNKRMNIYNNGLIFPSPELNMLKDKGVTFDVDLGCWGGKIDFDFTDEMINGKSEDEYNSFRYYCKWVGSTYCNNEYKSFYIKGNKDFIGLLQNEISADNMVTFNNEVRVSYKKKKNMVLPHICGFITSYMRINVLEQLESMDINSICKVVCDGIYYKGEPVQMKNCFRDEPKDITQNEGCESYISNPDVRKYTGYGEPREHNMVELHTGAGGCGKTHYNLTDKGFIGMSFYAPTWKLTRNKANDYNCKANTIAKIESSDPSVFGPQLRFCNVLVIDEVSMMSEKSKQQILKNMAGCKIIFCGDIGYQLPPFEEGNNEEFKKDITEIKHTHNYRAECEKLRELMIHCRSMMDKNKNIIPYVLNNIPSRETPQYNHETDMILATMHSIKNEYTEKYKDKMKYVITQSDEVYGRGEVYYQVPNTKHHELRHGYTTHSIQGETMKGNIFIDLRGVYDNRMIYTMISRAKRLSQIILI